MRTKIQTPFPKKKIQDTTPTLGKNCFCETIAAKLGKGLNSDNTQHQHGNGIKMYVCLTWPEMGTFQSFFIHL